MLAALAGCGGERRAPDTAGVELRRNLKTVAGLPQDGITLGKLDAPATLTVYASLDSFSVAFFRNDLPGLVTRWVRPGRLNLQVRTVTEVALGAPSDRGALVAAGVAQGVGIQDRLWQFYGALSARYIGSIDDKLLDAALADVQGIDRARVRKDAKSARINDAISRAEDLARDAKVSVLPTYVLEAPGSPARKLDASCSGCLEKSLARSLTP